MAAEPRLRMGMVGGGEGAFIGGVHRIAARMDGEIELVAGCFSRDPENSRRTGAELHLDPARVYGSYQEMAEKEAALPAEERIDFVSIVTTNSTHAPIASTFLQAGFHVVCDKPLTSTMEDAEALVELVESTGLVFVLTHNYTGNAVVREMRDRFLSGEMGRIRKVMAEYLQDFLMEPVEKTGKKGAIWRADPAQAGIAGTVADVGTHTINILEWVTGERVTELCADSTIFLPDRVLEEDSNMLIRLSDGGKGTLVVSQVATGEENALRLRLYAENGAFKWDQEHPNFLGFARFGEPSRTLTRASDYMTAVSKASARLPTGHPEGYLEAFANIYRDAAAIIRRHRQGAPIPLDQYAVPTVYDGLRGMQFVNAAVESAQNGSIWVKLP